jgi:hypothetical protein
VKMFLENLTFSPISWGYKNLERSLRDRPNQADIKSP